MHKRKGALANSPALFSLKLCIFFAFSCPFFAFFCPFISFFYPFPPFYLFPALLLSFYILIHLLFILFYPFSTFSPLIFHPISLYILQSFISFPYLLSLICSMYFLLYFLILYILFVLRFYPCFIYWLYNVLSVYNFSCAFQLLCSPY